VRVDGATIISWSTLAPDGGTYVLDPPDAGAHRNDEPDPCGRPHCLEHDDTLT
jgi:hypothetical protein